MHSPSLSSTSTSPHSSVSPMQGSVVCLHYICEAAPNVFLDKMEAEHNEEERFIISMLFKGHTTRSKAVPTVRYPVVVHVGPGYNRGTQNIQRRYSFRDSRIKTSSWYLLCILHACIAIIIRICNAVQVFWRSIRQKCLKMKQTIWEDILLNFGEYYFVELCRFSRQKSKPNQKRLTDLYSIYYVSVMHRINMRYYLNTPSNFPCASCFA